MSPFSRGRGLKLGGIAEGSRKALVALFTRAWIEIKTLSLVHNRIFVALFTRAWIEIQDKCLSRKAHLRRPFHEGVD